jgi:hypothetical protein
MDGLHGDHALPSAGFGDSNARHRTDIAVSACLFASLLALYGWLSAKLIAVPGGPYYHFDIWFGIDAPRVIDDMTVASADHYRTKVHPLYVLMVNPFGTALRWLGGGAGKEGTAAFISSTTGALNAVLAFALFRAVGGARLPSLLATLVFALSASQIYLSIVPDTFSLATTSMAVSYFLLWRACAGRPPRESSWVTAGVFTLGVTVTNAIQTGLCYALVQLRSGPWRQALRATARWTALTIAVCIVLSVLQRALYPSAALFFTPGGYGAEKQYVSFLIVREPLLVIEQLVKHFFVVNVVSGVGDRTPVDKAILGVTFAKSWSFSMTGAVALTLWATVLALVARLPRTSEQWWFTAGLGLCVGHNLALHAIYGIGEYGSTIEYFMYTPHFTLPILLAAFIGFVRAGRNVGAQLAVALLVAALAVHNFLAVSRVIELLT